MRRGLGDIPMRGHEGRKEQGHARARAVAAIGLAVMLAVAGVVPVEGDEMREKENMSGRAERVFRVRPGAGVDRTAMPTDIRADRGSDMCNLIGACGTLKKRAGWRQVAQLHGYTGTGELRYGSVHGMWHYDDGEQRCLIVHAGEALYEVDTTTWAWTEIDLGELTLADADTCGFSMAGRLWIVGGGTLMVYGSWDGGVSRRVYRVEDIPDIYVPTTTVGIADEGSPADSVRETLEAVNMLTAWRKNTMVGRDVEAGGAAVYLLDSRPERGSEVHVEIEVLDSRGMATVHRLKSVRYNETTMNAGGWIVSAVSLLVPEEAEPDENGTYGTTVGRVNYLDGTVTLEGCGTETDGSLITDMSPPSEGIDNITVTFKAEGGDRADVIGGASLGILFGEDGMSDRLLLGGFDGERNALYWSAPGDPTYFPDTERCEAGAVQSRILGLSRVSDGVLAIHKESLSQEPTIYYLTLTGTGDDEALTYTVTPRVVAGNLGDTLLAPRALCDFYGDPLVLTARGVMAVTMRSNLATTERQLVERSRSIRGDLQKARLEVLRRAASIVHRGHYYLALPGGVCYVADSGDTYTDESGRRQYEWYIYDNFPAVAFCVIDDRLYFGTRDGRICLVGEETDTIPAGEGSLYADRTWTALEVGDVSYNLEDRRLVYNAERLDIRAGDSLRVDTGLLEDMTPGGVWSSGGVFELEAVDDVAGLYEGMPVMPDGVVGIEGITPGTVYTVQRLDRVLGRFLLASGDDGSYLEVTVPKEAGMRLLRPLDGEELVIAEVWREGQVSFCTLKRFGDEEEPMRITTRSDSAGLTEEILGRVIRDEPVAAYWYSGYIDLGGAHLQKTLHRLTVAASPGGGRLTVGYETAHRVASYGASGAEGLRLGHLDFHDISFVGFAASYTKLLSCRRVNYVRFRFQSDTATPASVHEIATMYSVVGNLRGGL